MKKLKFLLLAPIVIIALVLSLTTPALAVNPQVTITVTAGVVSITNTQANWALGYATASEVIYFSATGAQDDDYSTANVTGNINVDIEIQGTDFDGSYPWILGATSDAEQYSLYANSTNGSATYNIEVKSSSYTNLVEDLAPNILYVWSMKFTAPSSFDANEDMAEKSATVTLVASEHT
jgi:hypothetical protein